MRHGTTVGRLKTRETTPAEIAKAMVGRDVQLAMDYVAEEFGKPTPPSGTPAGVEPLLRVRDLHVDNARRLPAVNGITFDVAPGEILGIAGVEGNGQTELLEAIAGLREVRSGSISISARDITNVSVRAPSPITAAMR